MKLFHFILRFSNAGKHSTLQIELASAINQAGKTQKLADPFTQDLVAWQEISTSTAFPEGG